MEELPALLFQWRFDHACAALPQSGVRPLYLNRCPGNIYPACAQCAYSCLREACPHQPMQFLAALAVLYLLLPGLLATFNWPKIGEHSFDSDKLVQLQALVVAGGYSKNLGSSALVLMDSVFILRTGESGYNGWMAAANLPGELAGANYLFFYPTNRNHPKTFDAMLKKPTKSLIG